MTPAQTQTRQAASDDSRAWFTPAVFWSLAIAVTGILLVLRRPDAVFHAQFWAEDGVVWYADAYNHGALRALLFARDGYLQLLPRLAAAVALWVPLLRAPLVLNLIALVIESLPPLFLVSSRMRNLGPLGLRCGLALLYLFVPDSSEVHAIITDAQSQIAVLACLVLIGEVPRSWWGKVFDVAVLTLCALTTPVGILLLLVGLARTVVPLLVRQWTKAAPAKPESHWRWIQVSLLGACALVQVLTLLTTAGARLNTTLGASVTKFCRIVAGQIVVPLFRGSNRLDQIANNPATVTLVAVVITMVTALVCLYALIRGSLELRCFLLLAMLVLLAALTFPSVEPVPYQWNLFLLPGVGLRYWYIPKLALMATLVWLLGRQRPAPIRLLAGVLVCVMMFSMVRHWQYSAFTDFHFASYVRVFEQLPSGTSFQIRVNPGGVWVMTLIKR
jgi:hypothetical protein